jgi:hypothetical protein
MPIYLTGSLAISGSIDAKSYTQNGQQLTSDPFPFTGSAIVSGSLNVVGNLLQNSVAIGTTPPFPFTGSALITGSLAVTGSVGFAYNSGGSVFTKTFDYSVTTGRTTVSDLIETSAERYKSNIQPLGSQLSNIMQLQPVEFDWKSNQNHDIGFIADSVQNVYPNLVSTNTQGEIEGMNYTKMVSALVKSIQEQQSQIDELQSKINDYNSN